MLIVALEGIFMLLALFGGFFHRCYALSAFIGAEIQSAVLFHRAIVTLRLLELSRIFAIVYRFRQAGCSASRGPEAPNIGRNDNAPPRFAVDSIRFFVVFFFVVFFGFMPTSILSWLSSLPKW